MLTRTQSYNFVPHHAPGVSNEIGDCLSRLCGVISRKEHTPDDDIRLLPISKKASVYKKELDIRDPLVERLAEIGGRDFDYINLLQNMENRTEYKHLPEDSELRLIRDSLPCFGIVELDSGERLVVRDGTEVLIPKSARKDVINTLHLTFSATNTMVLQTKSRLFWPGIRSDLDTFHNQCQECAWNRNSNHRRKMKLI